VNAGRKIKQTGWRVAVGVLLLAWIFHAIFLNEASRLAELQGIDWSKLSWGAQGRRAWTDGPAQLWKTITMIPPIPMGVSVALMGMTILLAMIRWQMVLRVPGLYLGAGRTAEISLVAHFFNSFLLGSTGGDLMKAYYAGRETHHKKTEAVVTVFVDRLIGLWALLLFGGIMMIPNLTLLFRHERLRALALLILAMLAGCSLIVGLAFWGGISRTWSGARVWLRRLPRGDWLERSLNSCRLFGKEPWLLIRTLSLSMILNVVCVFQIMVLSWGLHLPIPPAALFVAVPMIICISAIPITPSGLGVRENLFVFILADPSINVAGTSALSLSLLAYAGSLFWSLVGGIVYLTFKNRHHLYEADLVSKQES
jgi:glycosyltransferase 2 family protein